MTIPSRKNSDVSAVDTYTPTQCHASRPARVLIMLYMYMPLEEVLQNKAACMWV